MNYTIKEHYIKYYPEKLDYSDRLCNDRLNKGIIIKI